MARIRLDNISELKKFKEENPEGYQKITADVLRWSGRKFSGEDYLAMVNALVEQESISGAQKALADKGLECSKTTLENLVIQSRTLVREIKHEYPYTRKGVLTDDMMTELSQKINSLLAEHGLQFVPDSLNVSFAVQRADGKRFPANTVADLKDGIRPFSMDKDIRVIESRVYPQDLL